MRKHITEVLWAILIVVSVTALIAVIGFVCVQAANAQLSETTPCCIDLGDCIDATSATDCYLMGGQPGYDGVPCTATDCDIVLSGACCLASGSCMFSSGSTSLELGCVASGGAWLGYGTACPTEGPCMAPCPQDLTGDLSVDFADLLSLLTAWGECE